MIYHDNKKGIYEVEGKFIDIIGEIGSLLVFFLKNADIPQEVGER